MKIAFYNSKKYDRQFFDQANVVSRHQITYIESKLDLDTVFLAKGHDAVCTFVNDQITSPVLEILKKSSVKLIALRCAGFNQVDLRKAKELDIPVVRVPAYSPYAVAEHTFALILSLNRKTHHAFNRVREGDFSLDGLLGFDLHGKNIGVVGAGKIGLCVCQIAKGFGMNVFVFDKNINDQVKQIGGQYVEIDTLFRQSDIITLHCPLNPQTQYLINEKSIATMKKRVMLINTSRGAVMDTKAVVAALKTGQVGSLGIDVYEQEADLFFEDKSLEILQDDLFARLISFPNVLVTGHQAFFTHDALTKIAETTLQNISQIEKSVKCENRVEIDTN